MGFLSKSMELGVERKIQGVSGFSGRFSKFDKFGTGLRVPQGQHSSYKPTPVWRCNAHAFTLLELLVVVVIIGVLAALLLPAFSSVKTRGQGTSCLNNLKQLQLAWGLYVDDNNDEVPPNLAILTNDIWRSTPDSWVGFSNAKHDTDTENIRNSLLYKYEYAHETKVFHCPGDKSTTESQEGQGTRVLRTRSYSMNGNLGGRTSEVQRVVRLASEIANPTDVFVFIDENEDSIDDAHFLVWPAPDNRWVNMPADRHSQTGVLSLADGHVEQWKWRYSKSFFPKTSYWKVAENGADLLDLRRLQEKTVPILVPLTAGFGSKLGGTVNEAYGYLATR